MKNKLLVTMLVVVWTFSVSLLVEVVTVDYERYLMEGECVNEYVNAGVSRKDITTSHGKCYVEG